LEKEVVWQIDGRDVGGERINETCGIIG